MKLEVILTVRQQVKFCIKCLVIALKIRNKIIMARNSWVSTNRIIRCLDYQCREPSAQVYLQSDQPVSALRSAVYSKISDEIITRWRIHLAPWATLQTMKCISKIKQIKQVRLCNIHSLITESTPKLMVIKLETLECKTIRMMSHR